MEFFDSLHQGFASLGTWSIAASLLIGAALGIVVGVLPGVGPGVTIAVLLPFTYGMPRWRASRCCWVCIAALFMGVRSPPF